jgi:hypothetical protein
MKAIDDKLKNLKVEVADLAVKCQHIGDDRTHQLLLEVIELLDVTHDTFLGKALQNIPETMMRNIKKH